MYAWRTVAVIFYNACLCFQQLANSGTSPVSALSQVIQKPILQIATPKTNNPQKKNKNKNRRTIPRQPRKLDAQSTFLLQIPGKISGIGMGGGRCNLLCWVEGGYGFAKFHKFFHLFLWNSFLIFHELVFHGFQLNCPYITVHISLIHCFCGGKRNRSFLVCHHALTLVYLKKNLASRMRNSLLFIILYYLK